MNDQLVELGQMAWKERTWYLAECERGTLTRVSTRPLVQVSGDSTKSRETPPSLGRHHQVTGVSGDTTKSHVSRFVSGITGVSGATLAPETDPIFC